MHFQSVVQIVNKSLSTQDLRAIQKPNKKNSVTQATFSPTSAHSKSNIVATMTDELLVNGCLRNEPQYQQALYKKYRVEMFTLCLRYAKTRTEAEDFLQDGFMQVFRDLRQFDHTKGSLQGWVRKVMVNKALQHLRKKRLQYAYDDVSEYANQVPGDENIISMLSAQEIVMLIQQLPEGYKVVFNLFMIEGYSHQEIADMLGIAVNTSKSQLRKARLALQKKISELISA